MGPSAAVAGVEPFDGAEPFEPVGGRLEVCPQFLSLGVVGVGVVREGATVLTVTEEGKGRRTGVRDYRTQYRGGLGIRNYGSKGHVAGLKVIDDTDDIILISLEGIIIRMHV